MQVNSSSTEKQEILKYFFWIKILNPDNIHKKFLEQYSLEIFK